MVVRKLEVRVVGVVAEHGADRTVAASADRCAHELRRHGLGVKPNVIRRNVAYEVRVDVASDHDRVAHSAFRENVQDFLAIEGIAVPLLTTERADERSALVALEQRHLAQQFQSAVDRRRLLAAGLLISPSIMRVGRRARQ